MPKNCCLPNTGALTVQFYGYDFGGTGVFLFFAFMHSFQKLVSDFGHFQTLTCTVVKEINANECVRWIEAFIANLGHPLWGSQSMQELASGMRNVLPVLIRILFGQNHLIFVRAIKKKYLGKRLQPPPPPPPPQWNSSCSLCLWYSFKVRFSFHEIKTVQE